MFSATKSVVAGAVVALVGGVVLAGVLTQPSEEQAPAVGTSASAEVEPTEVQTSETRATPGGLGTFSPAGSPSGTRSAHRATLLPDGRVAVFGGIGPGNGVEPGEGLDAIETWNPETASFTSAGTLTTDRAYYHEAALLPNGRVLVVGGIDRTAEVWDPETESSTHAGSLPPSRPYGSQTILPDGRVLFVGGEGDDVEATASAVVWDPETATSVPAGTLLEARHHHTATVLADGRVLIVGGSGPSSSMLRSAEVWDDATLTFSPAGTLTVGRTGKVDGGRHTATLLSDGRVLVVGGGMAPTASAEVWDPATLTFSLAGTLARGRADHTASLLPDGRVLVIGGWSDFATDDADLRIVDLAEIWDPTTESFTVGPSLAEGRIGHTATVLDDGRVLVIGGDGWTGTGLTSAVVWEPSDGAPRSEGTGADTTATPDLLPGVDLVTEEVEPGGYRVLGDGASHDLELDVLSVAVSDEGSVWIDTFGGGIFELGRPGKHLGTGGGFLAFAEDGTLWAASGEGIGDCCEGDQHLRLRSFDGETWTEHGAIPDGMASGPDPWWPADYIVDFAVHPDGSVWQVANEVGDIGHLRVQHLGADAWTSYALGDGLPDLGCGIDCGGGMHLEITPDGMIWLGINEGGLLRFDGSDWETVRPLGGDVDHGVISLAANRDGVLWAEIWVGDDPPSPGTDLREERRLARFDGQVWEAFAWAPAVQGIAAVGPDGAVWMTDFYSDQDDDGRLDDPDLSEVRFTHLPVSFDGERWRRYPALLMDVASDPENQAVDYVLGASVMAVGPDGAVWVRGDAFGGTGGLYVITPEAVAAAD